MLKARDALRAKTANAAEKKNEKLPNERGDFAVMKELRQKMFEQQRQYVWSIHVYSKVYC